jgi:hypothetical protein
MSTPNHSQVPGQAEAANITSSTSLPQPRFTLASIAALYHSDLFALGFSNTERQAAARALLRHDSHQDGAHYHTKTSGGLHPSYITFNDIPTSPNQRMITHEEFVEGALRDLFDAVSFFDLVRTISYGLVLGLYAGPS